MVRPRVIFINRVYWPSPAATAQLLTDLAEGLTARGWDVHVIAAGSDGSSHHGVVIHRTGEGDRHGGLISRAQNYWRFIRQVRVQLRDVAKPGDIVVVMTDPPLLGAAITAAAIRQGARVVHWIQDIYPEIVGAHVGRIANALLYPLRLRRNSAWRKSSGTVVLGETMGNFVRNHGLAPSRVTTIPNWAPRELSSPPDSAAITAQRSAWGLTDKFIVVYSGNLGRVHEFSAILSAAEILRDRPGFVFVFIGSGARWEEVRAAVTIRQLTNVRMLPPAPRDALAASLAAADVQLVTLQPAFAELVYPSKLAGALAAARPVIFVGPPNGEIANFLAQYECGASFAPTDAARLAQTLVQWQTDATRLAERSRRARMAYETHFQFESALSRWEELLNKIASRE